MRNYSFNYQIITIMLCLSMVYGSQAKAQTRVNTRLKQQLDSVMALDQKYREALTIISDGSKTDSIAKVYHLPNDNNLAMGLWSLQSKIDSSNVVFAEDIIKRYGYPGKTIVGSPANESIWNIIQHSSKIDSYMPIIKKAAQQKELPYYLYGMMLDRQLMYAGKEQIYGSQGTFRQLKTGKKESIIWPVKDPETVNQRRKQAGFTQTVEDNALRFNIKYRVIKLDEILPQTAK